jgi:predicted DNA-binding transcriptional regulator YafY
VDLRLVHAGGVNRTDRLYALVEELRAAAPRARSAAWLARRFEVSGRTIERDISGLQQAGVPIWSTPGPSGGYTVDPAMTLPAVTFTPAEATAIAVALSLRASIPFADAGRSALRKLVGAMSDAGRDSVRELAHRIRLLEAAGELERTPVVRAAERALVEGRVLSIDYIDKEGKRTDRRLVEPQGLAGSPHGWYLLAWCRLREGGRAFRVDRITGARVTTQPAPRRSFDEITPSGAPAFRPVAIDE